MTSQPLAETGEETILGSDVPELPNFIHFLVSADPDSFWGKFLQYFENMIFSLLVAIVISILFSVAARKKAMIPSGLQNALEWIVEMLQKLISAILGHKGEKYVPFLGTLFIYVLSMNWFGLIPLMKSPSSNLNTTVGLAVCVFVLVQILNIKNRGILGFFYHLAGDPKGFVGWMIAPLMVPIELITQISRPVTLSLRLFGNILGEHILIGAFALLGVVLLPKLTFPAGIPLQFPFLFLALLTGLMQALVFTVLSAVYIFLSMPEVDNQH